MIARHDPEPKIEFTPTDEGPSVWIEAKASTGSWGERIYRVEEWITDVLELRDRRWLCVFTQKTPVL